MSKTENWFDGCRRESCHCHEAGSKPGVECEYVDWQSNDWKDAYDICADLALTGSATERLKAHAFMVLYNAQPRMKYADLIKLF